MTVSITSTRCQTFCEKEQGILNQKKIASMVVRCAAISMFTISTVSVAARLCESEHMGTHITPDRDLLTRVVMTSATVKINDVRN